MACNPLKCVCGKIYLPQRYLMAFMCLLAITCMYSHRLCINVAIVEMVAPSSKTKLVCPLLDNKTETIIKDIGGGKYEWSEADQSYILGSFYVGYLIGQVPLGMLCDKYGAKWFLTGGMLSSVIMTAIMPIIIEKTKNVYIIVALRVIIGIGQSVLYPAVSSLVAKWIPKNERSVVGGLTFSGNSIGAIFTNILSGYIISWTRSWPIVFYTFAILGMVWIIFFVLYVASEPSSHNNLTEKERELLMTEIAIVTKYNIPVKKILADPWLWGTAIGQIGNDCYNYTMLTNLPKYLNNVLNYDITSNGLISALPQIGLYVSALVYGRISDYMIIKKNIKIVYTRTIFMALATIFPGMFMLIGGYMECNAPWAVGMFVVSLIFKGAFYCSLKVNIIDVTHNFAAMVTAVTNGAGSLAGFGMPYLIGAIASENTLSQWKVVFWVIFIFGIVSFLIYELFIKGERADWDYVGDEELPPPKTKCVHYLSCYNPN